MSHRLGAAFVAALVLAAVPAAAAGHAIGQVFQLPIPLTLYLIGAGVAVAASFVVSAIVVRTPSEVAAYRTVPIPDPAGRIGSVVLAIVGLVWWYGAIAAGVFIGDVSPLPAVLLWIGIWVGLPIVAVLLGNPWPSLSPFRTTLNLLERVARLAGVRRLDLGFAYPAGLDRWPAVLLLGAALWAELILPESAVAGTVATLMAGYTVLAMAGLLVFGRVAWLRNGELLGVLLGWFGRVGPIGRRAVVPDLCAGCSEACDPARCIDCPECLAAAEPGELRLEARPWFTGLTEVRRATWSDAAFVVLALAGVTFDGLSETALWGTILGIVLPPLLELMGPTAGTFLLVETLGLVGLFALFLAIFLMAVVLTRLFGGPRDVGATAGQYAATLLPIAGGYLVAHYLTLVIQGAVWLPGLIADPIFAVAPDVGWIPISFVWYLSVGAIVAGHIAAIVLAHRIALRDAPRRSMVAGLPLVAVMVGYTVFSLWIIAQPIAIDPGIAPAGLAPR